MLKVHFIGVGGIGVSALARYYLMEGWDVSGSDIAESEITGDLKKSGVKFYQGIGSLKKIMPDVVIYSPAVQDGNSELKEARKLGIKAMSYPEALGQIAKNYYTIAVAGAHGKSTTTAMIALALMKAGFDPTVVVGTKVREFGNSNFRHGRSKYLVIEACEYDRSFLNYWPQMIILTNIEVDHLECYKNLGNLIAVFREFVGHLPQGGVLIVNADDANVAKMLSRKARKNVILKKYSLTEPEAARLKKILRVPGIHNVSNALAASAAAGLLKISPAKTRTALANFRGVWRRFDEEVATVAGKKITIVSDYGHHPTQIKTTLEGARAKWPRRRIICVFQPHQAYRTFLLFDDFVRTLKNVPVDDLVVTDIYQVAGREDARITKRVSAKRLVVAVGKPSVSYVPSTGLVNYLRRSVRSGDVLMLMGAGDIYSLAGKIKKMNHV